jgi:hypothetical protein
VFGAPVQFAVGLHPDHIAIGDLNGDLTPDVVVTNRDSNTTSVLLNAAVPPVVCYANCDGSSAAPVLNVNDFTCFLNRFAAGESYANCDASTVAPVLNVNDFTCFLNKYAAGCP